MHKKQTFVEQMQEYQEWITNKKCLFTIKTDEDYLPAIHDRMKEITLDFLFYLYLFSIARLESICYCYTTVIHMAF